VLALAGTAGAVVRLTAAGGREGSAALVAAGRLEAIRATACGLPPSSESVTGSDSAGPFVVRWSVIADGTTRAVRVTVSYADGRGARTVRYESLVACVP